MGEELVIQAEPIDYGYDRTLYARTLRYSPEDRIANQASWSRSMNELRAPRADG
jgi:hypothetical protein